MGVGAQQSFVTHEPVTLDPSSGRDERQVWGPDLGLTTRRNFFWATGGLSLMLDNAPTYVVFFETAKALTAKFGLTPAIDGVAEPLLAGISLGAVFMGAMT